ncbi:Repressor ROX1 [Mycena sanguinolenta]|uniref:Repressor ROX1 n=1 Tax=Mycena sanguinolenta TaxID=230812 RepID=A0A8H6YW45_9AGAR|nr:Repressor ROX1 [Mycena sanguinolenta]
MTTPTPRWLFGTKSHQQIGPPDLDFACDFTYTMSAFNIPDMAWATQDSGAPRHTERGSLIQCELAVADDEQHFEHTAHPATTTTNTPTSSRCLPPTSITPIVSPTPRAFTFPINHNLADSPEASPSSSPFEPDLRSLALSSSPASSSSRSSSEESSSSSPGFSSASSCSSIDSAGPRTPPPHAQAPLPLSAFTRTLSPVPVLVSSSLPSSSSFPSTSCSFPSTSAFPSASTSSFSALPLLAPTSPARKNSKSKSTPATEERRPKKGEDDYVKRPENAFILFRRQYCKPGSDASSSSSSPFFSDADSGVKLEESSGGKGGKGKKQRQADLSKTISAQWKALPPEERAKWEELAREKKREHEALHPGYVYRPQRGGRKNSAVAHPASASTSAPTAPPPAPAQTTPASPSTPVESTRRKRAPPAQIEFVVATPRQQHGRSTSAPAHPHQQVHVPNVLAGWTDPAESSSFSASSDQAFCSPSGSDPSWASPSSADYAPSEDFALPASQDAFSQEVYPGDAYLGGFDPSAEFSLANMLQSQSEFDYLPSSAPYSNWFDWDASASGAPVEVLFRLFSRDVPTFRAPTTTTTSRVVLLAQQRVLLHVPALIALFLAFHILSHLFPLVLVPPHTTTPPPRLRTPPPPHTPHTLEPAPAHNPWGSPWSSLAGANGGAPTTTLADGDFDIGRVPAAEVGWGFPPSSSSSFPSLGAPFELSSGDGAYGGGEGVGVGEYGMVPMHAGGEMEMEMEF